VRLREQLEEDEARRLHSCAMRAAESRGRLREEPPHRYRTAFARDRDRVLHSSAFRRLQYKTQVFVYHEGDHYRNRLTHTLEVAQIARTIARALGCNEDLTEAIVLAHDLGHTPFGHAGERALHRLMSDHGGFEHNRQSLRIVDLLDGGTPSLPGLNLTRETRAGIVKHGTDFPRYAHPVGLPELGASPGLEAQIADLSDEIAYHNHDIDDGLRSGLLVESDLAELELWQVAAERAARERPSDAGPRASIVTLIDTLVSDVVECSTRRIADSGVTTYQEVLDHPEALVAFSPGVAKGTEAVARFLRERLYEHHDVLRMAAKAERILRDLFGAYSADHRLLPPWVLERPGQEPQERGIADYLAGMTDRFAQDEHGKLFDPHVRA